MRSILLALAIVMTATYAVADSFDFRGAALGMTIEQFEALPPLKTGGKTHCVNETTYGLITCHRDGDDPFPVVQFLKGSDITYRFTPDQLGKQRLSLITMLIQRNRQAPALESLTKKFGPAKHRNVAGLSVEDPDFIWSRPGSIVSLAPYSVTGVITIIYRDEALTKLYVDSRKISAPF